MAWDATESFDGVEAIVFAYLPLIPFRPVHTYNWNGDQYQFIPIRWSLGLFLRAMAWRWLWAVIIATAVWAGITLVDAPSRRHAPFAIGVVASASVLQYLLYSSDRRNRSIRRVLGPHELGSSDPATWTGALLEGLESPEKLYGVPRRSQAVPALLEAGRFAEAMWAARLCVATESDAEGERLTEQILADPRVQAALASVGDNSQRWAQTLAGPPPVTPAA